ncbi:MAG: DUF1273 domain-containing protein [Oscillospiraceae bacterium]|jgi:uncharacterized phage-like protein YoqJ|nr:DUF1273 domain-containing protein [Oscillospiraceae bacterium]
MLPTSCGVCFTGHRPGRLGLSKQNEDELRFRLHQHIVKAVDEGFCNFYCGMAMGADIIAGELTAALREQFPELRLIAVVPFAGQCSRWPESWQRRWRALLSRADEQVILSPTYQQGCFQTRNRYMVDRAQRVIAVYDGSQKGGTFSTICYARKQGREIETVAPQ